MASGATSHFFIEQGALANQNLATQSFGPVSDSIFRLTSKFSVSAPKKAFSICKGVVLLQPQTGSTDKVNLILRPFNQPVPGLNIKYFIYRGLRKSDFVTNDPDPLVIGTSGSPSDFILKINDDFTAFHQEAPATTVIFTAKFIGYDSAQPLTTPLAAFFFKESEFVQSGQTFDEEDAYELPMIDAGKSLGYFPAGEGGIDVVLDYGDYKHDFDNAEFDLNVDYARAPGVEITVSGTTIADKRKREQVTQFIDIAAFYGCQTEIGTVKSTNSANVVAEKTGLQIYNELLTPFATKNTWYIYIQGDRTRSYDFYGNYKIVVGSPENLKTGITESVLTAREYQTNKWPVLINTTTLTPPAGNGRNTMFLQFVTDNNNDTSLYGQFGKIDNDQQNNFCNADDLRLPDTGLPVKFTKVISISTPSVVDASVNKNVAGISLLLYKGISYGYIAGEELEYNGETITIYGKPNFFDDVFNLIKSQPLLKTDGSTAFSKMSSSKLSLINHYFNQQQQGMSAVQNVTINDVIETGDDAIPPIARVTYLTEATDIQASSLSAVNAPTADTKTTPSANGTVGKSKTYELPEPFTYETMAFTDDMDTINGVKLKASDGSVPNKIILGITKDQNDLLKALITNDTKNPRLFLIDLFDDQNQLVSSEGISYQKFKVAIVAENTIGQCELLAPATDIIVFSLDRNCHFSENYSQYITDSASISVEQSPNY